MMGEDKHSENIIQTGQSINSSDPAYNSDAGQPKNSDNQTSTSNMEVHHHAGHHEKKNWKSYFWEFLMLFLAVFCGFFAEYQLEHKIERDREKAFIQTFIEDLKTDTAAIRPTLVYRKWKKEKMDSLMFLLENKQIRGYENALYFFGRIAVRSLRFQSNDRTITQLKNSGALRLIRNKQAADSIMSYQKWVEVIEGNYADDLIERNSVKPILARMFDPFVFEKMVTVEGIKRPVGNPPLRSYDPAIQQDLAHYIHQLNGSTYIIESRLEILNNKAVGIINFLNKEYHLD
jgi:hypothetical protein